MYTGYADLAADESVLGDDNSEPASKHDAAAEHEDTDGFVSQQSDTAARCVHRTSSVSSPHASSFAPQPSSCSEISAVASEGGNTNAFTKMMRAQQELAAAVASRRNRRRS